MDLLRSANCKGDGNREELRSQGTDTSERKNEIIQRTQHFGETPYLCHLLQPGVLRHIHESKHSKPAEPVPSFSFIVLMCL